MLKMILPASIILIGLILSIVSSTSICPQHKLPYPFGFSQQFKIRLNCSESNDIVIGKFKVQNVTQDNILINLPPDCDRTIETTLSLFGTNFALTMQNGLLLHKCPRSFTDCVVPEALIRNRLDSGTCNDTRRLTSCYSRQYEEGVQFLRYKDLNDTGCTRLFSSIAVMLDSSNSTVSLQFQTVELGWWLEGPCNCSSNATCVRFNITNGGSGYRCRCDIGFVGDGYAESLGCLRDHDCTASEYASSRCTKSGKLGVLVGGVIAGACTTALVIVALLLIRRKSRAIKNKISTRRLLFSAAGNSNIPLFPYKDIDRATNSFSENQRLGTGAYGTVYAGKLQSGEWVAIKKLKHRDSESIDLVMNEIKLLSCVSHPNLVRLLGCCLDMGEQILVYEFMPNGTLSEHLQKERGKGLPWTVRLKVAAETAQAISHLHNAMSPPIYHRDIKSNNILLDHNFNSKVADFGLSRLGMTELSHISTAPQGTPGYVDPQYHQNFHLSDKSDVYSFGVVLVEIITAMKVVDFSRAHCEVNLAALAVDKIGRGRVDDIIDGSIEPNRDAWTLSSVYKVAELAFRCLAFHSDMRPCMAEVADELERVRLSGWASMEDTIDFGSSVGSTGCYESEISTGVKEKVKHGSPVSVNERWLSSRLGSPPSTDTLLGNNNGK